MIHARKKFNETCFQNANHFLLLNYNQAAIKKHCDSKEDTQEMIHFEEW